MYNIYRWITRNNQQIRAMRLDDLVVDKAILKAVPEIENDNLALSLFDMNIRKFISDKKALGGLNSGALMYVGFIIDEIYENKNALVGIKGIGIPTANLIEYSVAEIFLKQNLPHPFTAVEYYKPILKKWRETFSPK